MHVSREGRTGSHLNKVLLGTPVCGRVILLGWTWTLTLNVNFAGSASPAAKDLEHRHMCTVARDHEQTHPLTAS